MNRLGGRVAPVTGGTSGIGCTTSICVESTVRDGLCRDDACVVLDDYTGEPIGHGLPRSHHDASLLVIHTLFGWVARSKAFITALERPLIAAAQESRSRLSIVCSSTGGCMSRLP
jgi:hypothetical protein